MKTEAEIRAWLLEETVLLDKEEDHGETGNRRWFNLNATVRTLRRVLGE